MAIKIYFGVPGSGKTTHAAKVVYQNLKHNIPTFCNVDIKGSIYFDVNDLGKYQIENCDMIIDEASIDFNNRNYKSLSQDIIKFFKLHRHYGVRNIYVYSQSYDDMDITIRRLANELYVVRKSIIPFVVTTIPIMVKIGIDEDTHQIIDQYFFRKLAFKLMWCPRYWCMFNSWECPQLQNKVWHVSGFSLYNPVDIPVYLKSIKQSRSLIRKLQRVVREKLFKVVPISTASHPVVVQRRNAGRSRKSEIPSSRIASSTEP